MGVKAVSPKNGVWYELRKNRGLLIVAFEDFDYKKGIFSPWK